MSAEHILVAAMIANNAKKANDTRGHLTTREMYAVQPNRSPLKTLLGTAKDKLSRR